VKASSMTDNITILRIIYISLIIIVSSL